MEDPNEEEYATDDNRSQAQVVHVASDFILEVSEAVGCRDALVKVQRPEEETGITDTAASVLGLEVGQNLYTGVDCFRVGHARWSC